MHRAISRRGLALWTLCVPGVLVGCSTKHFSTIDAVVPRADDRVAICLSTSSVTSTPNFRSGGSTDERSSGNSRAVELNLVTGTASMSRELPECQWPGFVHKKYRDVIDSVRRRADPAATVGHASGPTGEERVVMAALSADQQRLGVFFSDGSNYGAGGGRIVVMASTRGQVLAEWKVPLRVSALAFIGQNSLLWLTDENAHVADTTSFAVWRVLPQDLDSAAVSLNARSLDGDGWFCLIYGRDGHDDVVVVDSHQRRLIPWTMVNRSPPTAVARPRRA